MSGLTQTQARRILTFLPTVSDADVAKAMGVGIRDVWRVRTGRVWRKEWVRAGSPPRWTPAVMTAMPAPVAPRPIRWRRPTVLPDEGVLGEPVVGFRMWFVDENAVLTPTNYGKLRWTADMTGECQTTTMHNGQVPVVGCECGLHALKSMAALEERLSRYGDHGPRRVIVGALLLSGKTIEAETGYRSARAKIIAISAPPVEKLGHGAQETTDLMVEATAYNLNVPKVPYATLEWYASEFGQIRRVA